MWHVVGGEHSLKVSALTVCYDILKIWKKRMTDLINEWRNEWMNAWTSDNGVCITDLATQGLLNIQLLTGVHSNHNSAVVLLNILYKSWTHIFSLKLVRKLIFTNIATTKINVNLIYPEHKEALEDFSALWTLGWGVQKG